jgi:hypothetical protein
LGRIQASWEPPAPPRASNVSLALSPLYEVLQRHQHVKRVQLEHSPLRGPPPARLHRLPVLPVHFQTVSPRAPSAEVAHIWMCQAVEVCYHVGRVLKAPTPRPSEALHLPCACPVPLEVTAA